MEQILNVTLPKRVTDWSPVLSAPQQCVSSNTDPWVDMDRKREGKGLSENGSDNSTSHVSRWLLLHPCEIPPALPSAGGHSQSTCHGFVLCCAAGSQLIPLGSRERLSRQPSGDSSGSSKCSGLNAQSCQLQGHLPEHGNSFQICRSLGSPGALIP